MDIITAEGLQIPTVEELIAEIGDELHAKVDPTFDVSPESPEGQVAGIFCSKIREAYETLAVVSNIRPEDTEGFMADFVSALTGTRRNGATKTKFVGSRRLTLNIDDGVTVPAGSVVHVEDHPEIRVETTEDMTNPGGAPANFLVEAQALEFGPIPIYAGTLNVIATPVSGWNSAINLSDGETGRLSESDSELLARRERELRKPGTSTVPAMEVDLLSIVYEGQKLVTEARVFQNKTDFVDARGLPPHSFEALIFDGIGADLPDTVIAQQILLSHPAGIQDFGFVTANAIDSQGVIRPMRFSRPTILNIGAILEITYNPQRYIGDEALAIIVADAMKAIARSETLVRWSDLVEACDPKSKGGGAHGVTSVQSVQIDTFGADPFEDYQLALRTYPLWDSSDILIDSEAG